MELSFELISRQCLRRLHFSSIPELRAAASRCSERDNEDTKLFSWMKTANQLLGKATRNTKVNVFVLNQTQPNN